MHRWAILTCLLLAFDCGGGHTAEPGATPPVVLLHGLARTSRSMRPMARSLEAAGFRSCNLDYPSTALPLEELAEIHLLPKILACQGGDSGGISFVTHSLGGILVRYLAANHPELPIGRTVMLSPPNRGSEVVDKLGSFGIFQWFNGPAGQQLGTGTDSLPNRLGPPSFELGVITGDRSINPLLSLLIPGPDDGKVAVDRAGLDGMRDFLVVHASHPLIMRDREVIAETIHFLKQGTFQRPEHAP